MLKTISTLPLAALAMAAVPAAAQAQDYSDVPPLAPMGQNELRELPADMRSAPTPAPVTAIRPTETVTIENGVETVTRTRYINAPGAMPPAPHGYQGQGYATQYYGGQGYGYAAAPAVFERQQWIDECRRRTRGQNRDNTGLIIGGLLGAIGGGIAGYEIAGAGDRVLGTVLGVGGGGLLGGLLGSLFDGDKKKNLYDCEAALDSYLSAYGAPAPRIASRTIPYPAYDYGYGYGYPQGYAYGYTYAPPPQVVLVPVRTEVQQQVVVRETVREETYTVPGATRIITDPAPRPRPTKKMLRQR
ncbi:hypothetical protein [Erythrobacter sp. CCH5-A1]|jgi:hypothetical protein|uniref:hypothetical protein n=1 Tax=Erythrobacter sp. CCH5-A1 TaxID=1768792 RepID=UPI00082C46CE|nr:hypothetical protein [Erythrobacter sp. CCH5-A1]